MVRARRALGQNFLVDPNIQRKIVAAVGAGAADTVLEIGAGTGALTRHLAGHVTGLVAVEKDPRCVAALERELGDVAGVRIVEGDVLDLDLEAVVRDVSRLRVVGNIPYNITTPIVAWLLERRPRPAVIVLMVQREVADRIAAESGGTDYGALSVGVQSVARVERLFNVGRNTFRPVPDVDSAVIRLTPHAPPRLSSAEESALRTLTRAAFSRRRKQMQKTLRMAPEYALTPAALQALETETGIELERRPETLSPGEFITLTRALESHASRERA